MAKSVGFNGIALVGTDDLGASAAKSVTVKRGNKMIDVTALNDEDDVYMAGRKSVSGQLRVMYDSADAAVTALLTAEDEGSQVTLDIGPASTCHWTGPALISNVSFDNDGGDATILVFDYQSIGEWTKATS